MNCFSVSNLNFSGSHSYIENQIISHTSWSKVHYLDVIRTRVNILKPHAEANHGFVLFYKLLIFFGDVFAMILECNASFGTR